MSLCHSTSDVNRLPAGPKVVVAAGASLEAGPARSLLLQWGADPRNAVLLVEQPKVSECWVRCECVRVGQPLQLTATAHPPTQLHTHTHAYTTRPVTCKLKPKTTL